MHDHSDSQQPGADALNLAVVNQVRICVAHTKKGQQRFSVINFGFKAVTSLLCKARELEGGWAGGSFVLPDVFEADEMAECMIRVVSPKPYTLYSLNPKPYTLNFMYDPLDESQALDPHQKKPAQKSISPRFKLENCQKPNSQPLPIMNQASECVEGLCGDGENANGSGRPAAAAAAAAAAALEAPTRRGSATESC